MAQKILFTDMDGTLLTSEKMVSPTLQRLLTKMVASGCPLVLSSGRALNSILKVAQRAGLLYPDTIIIAANGNTVYDYDSRRCLLQKSVPMEIAQGVIDLAHDFGLHIQSYTDTHVVCEKDNAEIAYYKKYTGMDAIITENIMQTVGKAPYKLLAIDLKGREQLTKLQKAVLKHYGDTVTCIFSSNEYLEIFDKTAGKGNAIRFVCDYLGIPVTASVAVGDAENDLSMLAAAGIGVAMANASEVVKQRADYVTKKDCDHDGLAEVILQYFDI